MIRENVHKLSIKYEETLLKEEIPQAVFKVSIRS